MITKVAINLRRKYLIIRILKEGERYCKVLMTFIINMETKIKCILSKFKKYLLMMLIQEYAEFQTSMEGTMTKQKVR